ncbi:glycosyltransferase [Yoonia sp.]|uniref:glycosyltransferase n=1 Tax=Yoonia sp. TaxID=2212373 RepID=UPI002E0A320F|nr:glycosyltransferase [Yoonia sp.]
MTLLNTFEIAFSGAAPVSPSLAKTIIVVPCYNEADRLDGDVFLKTLAGSPDMSFVFVNDGSTDATLHCLEALQLANPSQIDVISLRRNSGKAEAVRKGLQHACRVGADHVGYWDADLATPLEAIADFEVVLGRYRDITVVYGARRRLLGHRINRTISRRAVSRICASLARLAVGLPIGDTQCGAKLLRNTSVLRNAIATPFTAGWLFDVELFSRIAAATPHSKMCFYEFPLSEWHEVAGSKVSSRAIVRSGVQMLRLIAHRFMAKPVIAKPDLPTRQGTAKVV